MTIGKEADMTQREATAWALFVSEIWYSLIDLSFAKKRRTYYKARGIVVYDRVLNYAVNGEDRNETVSSSTTSIAGDVLTAR